MSRSLSIIVPCYNEEGNVLSTLKDIEEAISGIIDDYEVIVVNDASRDRTGEVVEKYILTHPRVRCVHHERNLGLGATFYHGLDLATKQYVMSVFGDNEITKESLSFLFGEVGKADILIPYLTNHDIRPRHRQLISWSFGRIVNTLTRRKIRYYNGPAIHLRENLLRLPTRNSGFAYMAEILTLLLDSGVSYLEVPYQMRYRHYGATTAFRPRNCLSVVLTLGAIFKRRAGLSRVG